MFKHVGRDGIVCVARHQNVYVIADAYRGREIKLAISDFFAFAAGHAPEEVPVGDSVFVRAAGASDLVAYVGHDGLMDLGLDHYQYSADNKHNGARSGVRDARLVHPFANAGPPCW